MKKYTVNIIFFFLGIVCVFNSVIALSVSDSNLGSTFPLFAGIVFILYSSLRPLYLKLTANGLMRKLRILLNCLILTGIVCVFVIILCIIIGSSKIECFDNPDAIVILGAGLKGDIPSPTLANRLDAAIPCINENTNAIIVVSGGQGSNEKLSEAVAMKKYLIDRNIEESRIIMESNSTSTFENFFFTKEVLDEYFKGEDYTITFVTNDFHIFRSKILAARAGMQFNALPADSPGNIVVNLYLREFFAVIKSLIFDHI